MHIGKRTTVHANVLLKPTKSYAIVTYNPSNAAIGTWEFPKVSPTAVYENHQSHKPSFHMLAIQKDAILTWNTSLSSLYHCQKNASSSYFGFKYITALLTINRMTCKYDNTYMSKISRPCLENSQCKESFFGSVHTHYVITPQLEFAHIYCSEVMLTVLRKHSDKLRCPKNLGW